MTEKELKEIMKEKAAESNIVVHAEWCQVGEDKECSCSPYVIQWTDERPIKVLVEEVEVHFKGN